MGENKTIHGGRGRSNLYTYLTPYRAWGFVCKNWKSNGIMMGGGEMI